MLALRDTFRQTLGAHGIRLERAKTISLQVNVGFLCNQTCQHCHLEAGPGRKENMEAETAEAVIAYARRGEFEIADITGGAPELNPNLGMLIEGLFAPHRRLMLRTNLSALNDGTREYLFDLLRAHRVVVVASFPSLNEAQADSQRGKGTFLAAVAALRKLNALGYGREGSGLELNLVSNPAGAFLPASQKETEKRFREVLERQFNIVFNHLFVFANMPLGRFRQWLLRSGNLEAYLARLASSFNPCAVDGLMCKTQVSVSWNGYLYDCDFNLSRDLPLGGQKVHISQMKGRPEPGTPITVAEHCYTCTAGSGFT
jgi:radical SAM/Cys-rich protein